MMMKIIHRKLIVIATGVAVIASVAIQPIAGAKGVARECCSQNQNAPEWQRYAVKGEEFSVLLPRLPAMSTDTVYVDQFTNRRERILGSYADGVVYAIFTFEREAISLNDLIRDLTDQRYPSKEKEPVIVNGITGRDLRFESEDRMGAIQFFATKKNFYVFKAWGSKIGNPAVGIPKFLSSISFEPKPAGRMVVDGPGEQPISMTPTSPGGSGVFKSKDLTLKTLVITKPEPRYTEAARMHQITGTVVLRAVFSSSGALTDIDAVSKLPDGLTERAIEAARRIRFIPGIKDGRFVSTWIELQYNFNLY